MKTVIYMLLMVAVFMVVIGTLFLIFGSTTCDSLANQTAFDLKWAIDEVAKDESVGGPPFYLGGGVPESPVYYRSAPIRLCQQHGEISFIRSFIGGEPDYKIYYEKFPEGFFSGGSWLWSENYPWSGSAASSFVFWGAMRGITIGIKVISKVSVAYGLWKGAKLIKSLGTNVDDVRARDFLTALRDPDLFAQRVGLTDFFIESDLNKLVEGLTEQEMESILNGFKKAGFLQTDETGKLLMVNNKLVLSSQDTPVYIIDKVEQPDGTFSIVRKGIAFKQDPNKPAGLDFTKYIPLDNPDTAPISQVIDGDTYVTQMVNPSESIQNLIQDLQARGDNDFAQQLRDMFSFARTGDPVDDFVKPTLTQRLYSATVGKWKRFTDSLKRKLYNIKTTVLGPDYSKALFKATVDVYADPDYIDEMNDLLKTLDDANIGVWQRIKDRVRVALGLKTWQAVTVDRLKDYADELSKRGWVMVLHETDEANVWMVMMKKIWENPLEDTTIIRDFVKNNVPKFNEYFSNIPYLTTDINLDGLIGWLQGIATEPLMDEETFLRRGWGEFIRDTLQRLQSTDDLEVEYALKELQSFIGVLAADTDAMPITSLRGKFAKYGVTELRKIVLIDGRAFVTPTSWIARGLMGEFFEGCGDAGNNICVYSHGARMENPIFLSEDAQNFAGNIRVWRPVEVWKQYLGWQAALQHIPPHPRFYVVSPCFAMAKIWKARYNGEDTIFVAPEKLNLGDSASNYCYADTNLINAYTAIWFTADVLTVVETIVTLGVGPAAGQGAKALVGSVWKATDPVTLGQVIAEAAISWPGWPYKSLDFQIMQSKAGETVVEVLQD